MTMRTYDFTPLYRSAVGFDRLAGLLESAARTSQENGWPPYNIETTGENEYRIEIAVAGFKPDELTIEAKENQLRSLWDGFDRDKAAAVAEAEAHLAALARAQPRTDNVRLVLMPLHVEINQRLEREEANGGPGQSKARTGDQRRERRAIAMRQPHTASTCRGARVRRREAEEPGGRG
jgi:hypothetical protein